MADQQSGFVVGGDVDRVELSLRLRGEKLDPAEVTALLGVAPTFAARAGESVHRGSTVVRQPIGVWSYDLPASPEWILDDAIATLLTRFPSEMSVWKTLSSQYAIDVFCGLFMASVNRGTKVSAGTMSLLGSRGIHLSLDIYGHVDE